MRKIFIVTLVFGFIMALSNLALADPSSTSNPGDWTGNINLSLGMKYLDDYDWEPLEEQQELGIRVDFKQQGWPVSIAIDLFHSSDDKTMYVYDPWLGTVPVSVEANTSELCLGVRKLDTGIYWTLAEHLNIGFELRWSKADVSAYGIDVDAGGTHAGLFVGYHW
jgi:hypothetical protein